MQLEVNSTKNSKKSLELKKLVQGPQSHRAHCSEVGLTTLKTDQNRIHDHNESIRSKKSNKTVKSTGLLTQLKELNLKRSSQKNMLLPLMNKENRAHHKNKSTKQASGSLTYNNISATEAQHYNIPTRHLKFNSSMEVPKKLKMASTTTLNKEAKHIKFEEPAVKPSTVKNKTALKGFSNLKKAELTIKDFQLGRKLGKGRFGNVYLAQEKETRYALAIKIINIKQLKQSDMEDQLVQQIKIQIYCNHPNILKMIGFIKDQTNIYLLLELGTGCLFKDLRTKKLYSQDQTAYYIKQIVEALKYLHSENIIHRDIKPENILIVEGVLKLSDFGWSTYSPIQQRQTFCGTLDYVPPQIVQGNFYDQKVDIWSLGVLCYELATGRAPFQVPNDQESTYGKILSVQLSFPPHVSHELKDLISKILVKNPKERLSLSQIDKHPWLVKHSKVGRYISKQVWENWDAINHK